jgi:DNA-binding XRE family transcriptional regulator
MGTNDNFVTEDIDEIKRQFPDYDDNEILMRHYAAIVANELKKYRYEHSLEQCDFCKNLEMSKGRLSNIESCGSPLSIKLLIRIARAMGKELVIEFK